jgi:hypothetical protein
LATAHNAALRGQNATTVKIKDPRIITAERTNHTRYRGGVVHPLIRAPNEANITATEMGWKNWPVSTG